MLTSIPVNDFIDPPAGSRPYNAVARAVEIKPDIHLIGNIEAENGVERYFRVQCKKRNRHLVILWLDDISGEPVAKCDCEAHIVPHAPTPCVHVAGVLIYEAAHRPVEIPLSQGKVAMVDAEDAERVLKFKWCWSSGSKRRQEYAVRTAYNVDGKGKNVTVRLHRFVLNAPDGIRIDHQDGNGLNCQKANLRPASAAQNQQNMRASRKSATGLKGVTFLSARYKRRYYASIMANGMNYPLGYFEKAKDAAMAYDTKARELHGKFARLNYPLPGEQRA